MVNVVAAIVAAVGAIISVTGGMVGFLLVPKFIPGRVAESVKLIEGSEAFERWENVPIPITFKVYFFNVTNPDDVQNGAQPIVTEIGPYVYNQYRTKMNITTDDDIVSYYEHRLFEFSTEKSAPLTETDEITIVNLPLMSIVTTAEYTSGGSTTQMTSLNSAIRTIFSDPSSVFKTTTPRDFLFEGEYVLCNNTRLINRIVCNRIEAQAPDSLPRLDDGRFRFTFLGNQNDTDDGYYSINNGVNDVSQLGEIYAWENSSTLDSWAENSTCNNIFGTDASVFPPFQTSESNLAVFSTDICRSVNLDYSEVTEFSDILALRYVVNENTLASPSSYPENECFCLNRTEGIRGDDGCLLDGAMELWDCQGAPVVLTFPHFYLATETYRDGVAGLSPDESLHGMFLELEPTTGTLLRGSTRVQFNIFLRPISYITLTTNLNTTLMPILWVDEGVELTDELIAILNAQLFDVLDTISMITWGTVTGGAICFTLGFVWLLV